MRALLFATSVLSVLACTGGLSDKDEEPDDTEGDADTDADSDTDTGPIELYAISPASAPEGEAVNVVLSGAGFVTGAAAHIGGVSLTGTEVQADGTVSGRTPTSLPAGEHDVEVVNPDGTSAYIASAFTVEGEEEKEAGLCGCAASPITGFGGALLGLLALVPLALVRRRE